VIFWIHLALGRVLQDGACPPPIVNGMSMKIGQLMNCFYQLDKIDKMQFPLPYAQIVKLLTIFVVFTLPFYLAGAGGAKWITYVLTELAAIGFFGMDEVSEVLESPLGCDANHIELSDYGRALMADLQLIYESRDSKLDVVFSDDMPFNFGALLEPDEKEHHRESLTAIRTHSGSLIATSTSWSNSKLETNIETSVQPTLTPQSKYVSNDGSRLISDKASTAQNFGKSTVVPEFDDISRKSDK
jgi:hypothetical protein